MSYKPATVDFTTKQIEQMAKGKPVRLTHNQLGKGNKVILLHPENHNKLSKAYMSGRGCNMHIAEGEVMATHKSNMDGTGFFDTIKKGLSYLKDSGIASILADSLQTAATPFVGETAANLGRKILKGTTGVGVPKKRVSRKTNILNGGSFLMPHQ
jgi:hypothetical protein